MWYQNQRDAITLILTHNAIKIYGQEYIYQVI